ncbi:hypothetical protein VTH06DRAFT_3064 [Thermothelomyces fergusii]
MSLSRPREEEGPAGSIPDEPELQPADDAGSGSDDGETVKGEGDEDRLADVLDQGELQTDSDAPRAAGSGPSSIAHRYGELVEAGRQTPSEEDDDHDDDGSTDAAPRVAVSPIGSLLSVPDDTPSIQVTTRE